MIRGLDNRIMETNHTWMKLRSSLLPIAVTYYHANIIARLQITKDPKPAGWTRHVTPKIVASSAGFGFLYRNLSIVSAPTPYPTGAEQ
jgi:hypothetical protein